MVSALKTDRHHVQPVRSDGMDQSAHTNRHAVSRDQIDRGPSRAQKAQKSAFLAPQPAENFRHHHPMYTMDDFTIAIDLPELAAGIGANARSLRNAFYLHPDQFPPAIYLPGTRGPRFLVSDVLIWLEARKAKTQPAQSTATAPKPQGRPRKASAGQIARARQGQGGAA